MIDLLDDMSMTKSLRVLRVLRSEVGCELLGVEQQILVVIGEELRKGGYGYPQATANEMFDAFLSEVSSICT